MKWLLEFTKWLFETPRSSLTLDTHRGRIYLVPQTENGLQLAPRVFSALCKKKKANSFHRKMSAFLGLNHIVIEFRRTVPKGSVTV